MYIRRSIAVERDEAAFHRFANVERNTINVKIFAGGVK
jgi:hypothetical protein